ncbi:MAG: N-acetyl-gamma-glutamyl-phosphate reductase [Candidatus Kapaibacterium sp.]
MIRAGIVGVSGFTGGELARLLLRHPEASIAWAMSTTQAGMRLSDVHRDLEGDTDIVLRAEPDADCDVVFLCVDHGTASSLLASYPWMMSRMVIDLSNEYRLQDASHDFVYGLPEAYREHIRSARHVANPGCFATAIQLGLLPLAAHGLIADDVHVSAVTGSTGAGRKAEPTVHFSWRSGNVQVYKPFTHQHVPEIHATLRTLQPAMRSEVLFIPQRGNFTRGILASMYTSCSATEAELTTMFEAYYADHPFVVVTGDSPDLKRVVNTNKACVWVTSHKGKVLVVSVIDNLLKGASGQAVQNMNLMCGLEESAGLALKPSVY